MAIIFCVNPWVVAQDSILGFTPASAERQKSVEQKFKSIPSPEEKAPASHLHSGTAHRWIGAQQRTGAYIAEEWKKQGLEDVVIHRYDVYATFPKSTSLELVAPVPFKASLREQAYRVDPDTKNPNVTPAWSGMSISGEVTAPVVYAHSGNPEDYAVLKNAGIDVSGKIVLVRYSNPYSYRGFKALTAEREGAAAMLVYSDPAEDGYKHGKVVPDGPWGPESHIQRGAITYDFIVPGDPLTPGWASVDGAKRIPVSEAKSLPKIMALPLSWADAKPLSKTWTGPMRPEPGKAVCRSSIAWAGARAVVHLKIEMDNSIKPYYVVEARIRGTRNSGRVGGSGEPS